MTAFGIAVWFALALGSFGIGTGVVQQKQGCFIDPNGGSCTKGEIAWADEAHHAPQPNGASADQGSSIDPNGR